MSTTSLNDAEGSRSRLIRKAKSLSGELVSFEAGPVKETSDVAQQVQEAHGLARDLSSGPWQLSERERLTLHRLIAFILKNDGDNSQLDGLIQDVVERKGDDELCKTLRKRHLGEILGCKARLAGDGEWDILVERLQLVISQEELLSAFLELLTTEVASRVSRALSSLLLTSNGLKAFIKMCSHEVQGRGVDQDWVNRLLLAVPKSMSNESYFSRLTAQLLQSLDDLTPEESQLVVRVLSAMLTKHPRPMSRHIIKPLQAPWIQGRLETALPCRRLQSFARYSLEKNQVIQVISPILPSLFAIFALGQTDKPDAELDSIPLDQGFTRSTVLLDPELKLAVEGALFAYFEALMKDDAVAEILRLFHLNLDQVLPSWRISPDGTLTSGGDFHGSNLAVVQLLVSLKNKRLTQALFLAAFEEYALLRDNNDEILSKRQLSLSQIVLLLIHHFQSDLVTTPQEILELLNKTLGKASRWEDTNVARDDEDWIIMSMSLLETIIVENTIFDGAARKIILALAAKMKVLAKHPLQEVASKAKDLQGLLATVKTKAGDTSAAAQPTPDDQLEAAFSMLREDTVPARAHGINILRDVVLHQPPNSLPIHRILTALENALGDEDSFVYLNTIKALAAMTEAIGPEILAKISSSYANCRHDESQLDTGLRLGEALLQIVQRAGETIYSRVNLVVPSISTVLRDFQASSILRTSALSLIGEMMAIAPNAMIPFAWDAIDAALTILELERPAQTLRYRVEDESESKDELNLLRRAAAVCLYRFAKGLENRQSIISAWPTGTMSRTTRVLRWAMDTDPDDLVRWQASAAMDEIDQQVFAEPVRKPMIVELGGSTSARVLPRQPVAPAKGIATVRNLEMYCWGCTMLLSSYLLFTFGLYALLFCGDKAEPMTDEAKLRKHVSLTTFEYFSFLPPLLIPVGFWCLFVSWIGMKIFRHV